MMLGLFSGGIALWDVGKMKLAEAMVRHIKAKRIFFKVI
jgi:hypothetical protein